MSSGGRPSKDFRLKANGDSVQAFIRGVYVGSIPLDELCQYIRDRKRAKEVLAQ